MTTPARRLQDTTDAKLPSASACSAAAITQARALRCAQAHQGPEPRAARAVGATRRGLTAPVHGATINCVMAVVIGPNR